MNHSPAAISPQSAADEYTRRLDARKALQAIDRRRERRLGYAKLGIAALGLLLAALLLHRSVLVAILAVFVCGFIVLAVLQERLLNAIRYRGRAIQFYERGLARLRGGWAGAGDTGERFLDPSHPYARDLDLFGDSSLFQFLCAARTRAGEEILAQWLLAAASVDEIVARQAAIRDV